MKEHEPITWEADFPVDDPEWLEGFVAPWSGRYEFTSEGVFALDPPPHDPKA